MDSDTPKVRFSARDIFLPSSPYTGMRLCFDPDLKMRGLFYHLEAQRLATTLAPEILVMPTREPESSSQGPGSAAAKGLPVSLAFFSDPPRRVASNRRIEFERSRARPNESTLRVRLALPLPADRPSPETRCRSFVLTPGVIGRLCGAAGRSATETEAESLTRLFEGKSDADRLKVSESLAATAEMNRTFSPGGNCEFAFELPSQASEIKAFPDGTVFVFVIEGRDTGIDHVRPGD